VDSKKRKEIESTLERHGRILTAVNRAAEQLVLSSKWLGFVEKMICEIGEVMGASRIRVVKNHIGDDEDILASQQYQWLNNDIIPPETEEDLKNLSYKAMGFNHWLQRFQNGEIFSGKVSDMSGPGAEWLAARRVKYITCAPIMVADFCWGVIGFEEWHSESPPSSAEVIALETAARLIGAAIHRDRIEKDLASKQAQLAHVGRFTALGEMASGLAHEINQPLTVINLSADICSAYFNKHVNGGLEAEAAKDIRIQVKKIANLVQNMRSFSKRSSGGTELIDLAEPTLLALTFFRQQFRAHQIDLQESIADSLPLISSDRQKFEQIVVNLLSNARYAVDKKFEQRTDYERRITVRLFQDTFSQERIGALNIDPSETSFCQIIVLEVIDNGIGMSEAVKKRCLEPFFTTKEVGEGTGLGLSVAYGLVRELGFHLEIESRDNIGSTFSVVIPVKKHETIVD
jgi:signal transduction histidine kinase